jgi:HSP20 family protein
MPMVDPSREFEDLYARMGQLLNMAFGDMPFGQMQMMNAPWVPLADVAETDDAYTVEVELPGVRKDQVNVELNDRELVISGEIPEPAEEGERRRRSRRSGRFEFRTILAGEVNPDGVSANLSDGVLSVKIPKAEEAKPRRIQITG